MSQKFKSQIDAEQGIEISSRLVIQNSSIYDNAANGNNKGFGIGGAGLVPLNGSGVDTNNLVDIGTSDYKFKNLHLSGFIQADGNITTDGIFKVDTAPDDNILEVTQSGRKMAFKTSFAGDTVGSFWAFRVSDGSTNGSMTDALIVKPQQATFAGSLTANGNITTDGIFINESAPDDEVVQFIQAGRKTSLKTHFSTAATGSFLDFRISNGNVDGSFSTPLRLYPDRVDITTAEFDTIKTNNIAKLTTGSPILINSGSDASLALKVYYDMQLYNTLSFTDSSWTTKGRISANSSGVLAIQGGSGTSTIYINSTDQVKIRNNADLGTYTRLGIAMDVEGNAANLDEATDYNAMSIAPYRVDSSYGMYFGGGHGANSSAGFIQSAKVDGTDSSTISLNPFGGNVGINTGTSDPANTLHVVGSFRTDLESTFNMGILNEYVSQYVSRTKFGRISTSSNLEIYYDIANTEEARITRNYTVAPLKFMRGNTLDMEITGAGNVLIPGEGKYLKFGGYSYIGESLEDLHSLTIASDFTESLRFSHYNRTTSAYELNMIIDQNSRVGIGNATPMARLTIGSSQGSSLDFSYDATNGYRNNISNYWNSSTDTRMDFNIGRTANVAPVTVMSVGYNSNVGINTQTPAADLHVTTNGTSSEDGIVKIGGSTASLGLVLEYDQVNATFSYITANPTYTSDTSIMKIRVDGDRNPDQLVLKGDGNVTFSGASTYHKIETYYSGDYTSGFKFSDLYGGIWYDAANDDLTLNSGHPNSQIIFNSGGSLALTLDASQNAILGVNKWLNGYAVAGSTQQNLIRSRAMGYPGYYGLQIGQETNHIALFIDPGSVIGGAFSGNVNEIMLPNKVIFQQANSGGTDWLNGQSLTLDNAKLGLGINTPLTKFHIQDGAGGGNPTDSRTKIYIDSSGEAYISVNVPTDSFGGIRLAAAGTNKAFFELYDNTSQGQKLSLGTVDARDVVINTSNTDRVRIKGNGSVGINCDAGNMQLKVLQTRTSEWAGGFINTGSIGYGLYVDTSSSVNTQYNFACYTNTGDGMALNGDGRLHIGNKTSFPAKLTVTSSDNALKAVEASKPYAASQNIASFTNGNAFVRNSYDTFTIAQTDVACLVITETVNASNQGTEQRLTLTVGDNKCVIGTSSTVTAGMYFNVARSTSAVGYNADLGITALHLTNNGDATFGRDVLPVAENACSIGTLALRWENVVADQVYGRDVYVDDYIYHAGDTNTYIRFEEDKFTFRTGGEDRAILNNNALNVGPHGTTSTTVNDGPLRVCNNSNGNNDMGRGSNAIQLGPKTTRNATANYYYGGITWNGLLNYGNGTGYDAAPHVWVGAKYKDFPGSERSSFVVGIKSGTGATGSGNDIPVERLTVDFNGTLTATGDVIAYSDVRVKENINTVKNALDTVTKLRGVTYTRKDIDDKSTKVGVIAQEVLDVIPEVVQLDDNDRYSVAYGNMAGIFIEAIKELKAEVDSLKEQLKNK